MDNSILTKIIIVLIGTFVTFLLSLLAFKLQKKRPKLTWRKLSNIKIPANQLTGVNWLIENIGNQYAKDVNVIVKLPNEATFRTLDCVSSEIALEYTNILNEANNEVKIHIPIFPQNISLDISSLIKNFSNEIEISIIGEGTVGKKHNQNEKSKLLKKYSNIITATVLTVYVVGVMSMFGFIAVLLDSKLEYEQTRSIANIYIKSGEPDEAIKLYQHYSDNAFMMKKSPSLLFEAIRIYGETNKKDKAINLIHKLTNQINKKNAPKYLYFLKHDASLDKFRADKEFTLAIKQKFPSHIKL